MVTMMSPTHAPMNAPMNGMMTQNGVMAQAQAQNGYNQQGYDMKMQPMNGAPMQGFNPAMQQFQQGGFQPAPNPVGSLYVGDLSPDVVSEKELHDHFAPMGPLASIRLCRDSQTRKSLGYAYVNYVNHAHAQKALKELNFSSIMGSPCRIMWSHRDPSVRKSGSSNVFVKNLDKKIDNKALYETFSLFGQILSCKVALDDKGRSLGYGFVHYEDESAASQAIERVNNMQIGEKTVFVGPFQARGERTESEAPAIFTNLYVKNFPADYAEEDVTKMFQTFGAITSVFLSADNKGRKFAFVNFLEPEHAKAAVEALNGKDLRTDEQKEVYEKEKESRLKEGLPELDAGLLFVGRAQTKRERQRELKDFHLHLNTSKSTNSTPEATAVKPAEPPPGLNLYVKNLDDSIDDEGLKTIFADYGDIGSVKVMCDEKGKSRGFGFVFLMDAEKAQKAVSDLHLKIVSGKPLYVGVAEKREHRQARLRAQFSASPPGPQQPQQQQMTMNSSAPMNPGMPNGGMSMQNGQMFFNNGNGGVNMRPNPSMMQMGAGNLTNNGGNNRFSPAMNGMGGGMGGMSMNNNMSQNMNGGGSRIQQYGMSTNNMQQRMGQGQGQGQPQQHFPTGMNMNNRAMNVNGPMPGKGPQGMMQRAPMTNSNQQQQQYNFTSTARNQQQMPNNQAQNNNFAAQQNQGQNPSKPFNPQQNQTQNRDRNFDPAAPLTAAVLAAAPPLMQKQMLGEKLFPAVAQHQPELAGKITGMMLEMDNSELLMLLESESQMKNKVDEALRVLDAQMAK